MPKEFEKEELEELLKTISEKLSKNISIYLFGGAVMVFNNLKISTKDIDILFKSKEDYLLFVNAAKKSGFITKHIPSEYSQFNMSLMLENLKTGWRLDLFLNKVCEKFKFNKDVQKRSKQIIKQNKLNTFFISLEDIFIMKALTQRDRDLEDMNLILGYGLKFNEILTEIENQKKHKFDILERLFDFEEKHNLNLGLPSKLKKELIEHNNQLINKLLEKQVKEMIDENKKKVEIMQEFELTEEEW